MVNLRLFFNYNEFTGAVTNDLLIKDIKIMIGDTLHSCKVKHVLISMGKPEVYVNVRLDSEQIESALDENKKISYAMAEFTEKNKSYRTIKTEKVTRLI